MTIIDDRLARIGSANLNNRSGGFDTECDVAIEARTDEQFDAIARLRAGLIGHFAGAAPGDVEVLIREQGLATAAEHLAVRSAGRLTPIDAAKPGPIGSLIAAYHLGDPQDPADSWRPVLRRKRLRADARRIALAAGSSCPLIDPEVDD